MKMSRRLGAGLGILGWFVLLTGRAMAQTAAPSTGGASPSPSGPILPSSTTALTLVAIAALALVLVWVVPLTIDLRRAYRGKADAWRTILARLEKDAAAGTEGLSLDKLNAFLPLIVRPPEGMRGLARVLLAFLITSLVGLLSLALLFSPAAGVFDVVKQIVTGLLGVLATLIGFYFGARTAEGAAAAATPSTSSAGSDAGPASSTPHTGGVVNSMEPAPEETTSGAAAPSPTLESTQLS